MIPHKRNGTHVFVNNKSNNPRFLEKRENQRQMKVKASKFKPFMLVENENGKTIIVAGNVKASPLEFDNEKEAEKYLREQPYEMFTNLYSIFKFYENEKENKKQD